SREFLASYVAATRATNSSSVSVFPGRPVLGGGSVTSKKTSVSRASSYSATKTCSKRSTSSCGSLRRASGHRYCTHIPKDDGRVSASSQASKGRTTTAARTEYG